MARTNIMNRMIFIDNRNSRIRFGDWNIVHYDGFGMMIEPRRLAEMCINDYDKADASFDDMLLRIDAMGTKNLDEPFYKDVNGEVLHDGPQIPRSYSYSDPG